MNEGNRRQKPSLCRIFVLCLVLGAQASAITLLMEGETNRWGVHETVVVLNALFGGVAWLVFVNEEDRSADGAD